MSVGQWLLGWILGGTIIFAGINRGWPLVTIGGALFAFLWWYVPDVLNGHHEDPPEDIR